MPFSRARLKLKLEMVKRSRDKHLPANLACFSLEGAGNG